MEQLSRCRITLYLIALSLAFGPLNAAFSITILQSLRQIDQSNVAARSEPDAQLLELGKPVERELKGGEAHSYRLSLIAGQFLYAVVDQRKIDVIVRLYGVDGKQVIPEVDSPNGENGPEPVRAIANASGDYRLEILSPDARAKPGRYILKIEELRKSTEQDGVRVAAERAFMDAELLRTQGILESIRKSILKYEESLLIRRGLGDKAREATTFNRIAETYYALGDRTKALEYFNRALPISRTVQDHSILAVTLHSLGFVHDSMGNKKEALKYYDQVLPIFRGLRDGLGEATTLNRIGSVYNITGKIAEALKYYNRALPISRALKDHSIFAGTLNNIGSVYNLIGDRTKALKYFNQALSISRTVQDRSVFATTLNNIGSVYNISGKNAEALKYFNQALPIFQGLRNHLGEAATLNNIGSVYNLTGKDAEALKNFNQALLISRAAQDRATEAATLNNIGSVYNLIGDRQESLKYYYQALSLRKAVQDRSGEATTLNSLGQSYDLIGDRQKALEHYNQALLIFRAAQNRSGEAAALNNIGLFYHSSGKNAEALKYFNQALPIFRGLRNRASEAAALHNLGAVYDSRGNIQKALEYLYRALSIRRAIPDRLGEAATLHNIGATYKSTGNPQKALEYFNRSLSIFRELGNRLGEASALGGIGVVYDLSGEKQEALDWYKQAIDKAESARSNVTIEEIKTGLSNQAIAAYKRASLILTRFEQHIEAFNFTERARARTFLDQIGNIRLNPLKTSDTQLIKEEQALASELISLEQRRKYERSKPAAALNVGEIRSIEDQLADKQSKYEDLLMSLKLNNSEYVSLRSIDTLTLPEVQQALDKDTTLLVYYVTAGKTLAFVISRDSFRAVGILVKERELIEAITWFRYFANLRKPHPETLKQLHDRLIAPVKQYINTTKVGIIPHGVLHYLPFAALTDGQRYFGDDHTLFYLPSASVLPFIQSKSKPLGPRVLAIAQSRAEGLASLPYADEEVETVANIFNTEAFTTGKTVKSEFMKRAGEYSIVHIAAHAELNTSSPLFSRIILAEDKNDTGALSVHEVYKLDLSETSLVVLSACETQLGAQSEGDDVVGLNRAFIYAGTPTVIASLWTVDDESTSHLMKAFYTHLKGGMSKAEALRAAQSDTRKKYPHPYYWSAFVLAGDPGQTTSNNQPGNRPSNIMSGPRRRVLTEEKVIAPVRLDMPRSPMASSP
jgi:CHAT domain-containing protein/Tfp pilus assembly protein PilF